MYLYAKEKDVKSKLYIFMFCLCVLLFLGSCGKEEVQNTHNIDFTKEGMIYDGVTIKIPVEMSELVELWGEPRVTVHVMGDDPKTSWERYNCTWDELGIHCYVNQGEPVHCIAVMVNKNADYEHYPKEEYQGEVLIEGEPWYKVLPQGTDFEFFREVIVGNYSLVGEYIDVIQPEATHTEADYVGIEMSANN